MPFESKFLLKGISAGGWNFCSEETQGTPSPPPAWQCITSDGEQQHKHKETNPHIFHHLYLSNNAIGTPEGDMEVRGGNTEAWKGDDMTWGGTDLSLLKAAIVALATITGFLFASKPNLGSRFSWLQSSSCLKDHVHNQSKPPNISSTLPALGSPANSYSRLPDWLKAPWSDLITFLRT